MVMKHVNCSCCTREVYIPLTNVPVGVVQGDYWIVKPVGTGNISETYIAKRGEHELYLADFGNYKTMLLESGDSLDHVNFSGTVADYMSPEQIRRSPAIDHRSDIYSLGATLFYLCTGQEPYKDDTLVEITDEHINAPPPNASRVDDQVDPHVAKLIKAMMAKDPADRIQSWPNVIERIRAIHKSSSRPQSQRTVSRSFRPAAVPARVDNSLRTIIALLGLLIVVVATGIAWLLFHQPPPPPPPIAQAPRSRQPYRIPAPPRNAPPFSIDLSRQQADCGQPILGSHVIEAQPYSKKDAQGAAGKPMKIEFTIAPPKPPPAEPAAAPYDGPISFILVDADQDKKIRPIQDGSTIDLGQHPAVNIIAEVRGQVSRVSAAACSYRTSSERIAEFAREKSPIRCASRYRKSHFEPRKFAG